MVVEDGGVTVRADRAGCSTIKASRLEEPKRAACVTGGKRHFLRDESSATTPVIEAYISARACCAEADESQSRHEHPTFVTHSTSPFMPIRLLQPLHINV